MACMSLGNLLSLDAAAEELKISLVTLWRWTKQGKITPVRLSAAKVFIRQEEITRFIRDSERKA